MYVMFVLYVCMCCKYLCTTTKNGRHEESRVVVVVVVVALVLTSCTWRFEEGDDPEYLSHITRKSDRCEEAIRITL